MKKRLLSLALAGLMCVSLATTALASGTDFPDVAPNHWAAKQIGQAKEVGLFQGYPDGGFHPEDPVTGAQFMTVLVNKYCPQDVNVDMAHQCGISGRWYDGQFYAADKNHFLDDLPLEEGWAKVLDAKAPRELLVAMLYNAAGRPEVDESALDKYTDRGDVASYAVPGFSWAVSNGIVSGTSITTLSPKGTATRAQVAVIMIRYIEKFEGEETSKPAETTPEQKPVQPETGKTYESASELVNAYDFTEETKSYIESDGFTVLTNADTVNAVSNVGKQVQTIGNTTTANKNGYHTEATVDVSGAVLDYEALDALNEYRVNWIKNAIKDPNYYVPEKHDLKWTIGDIGEETALVSAKYAKCSDYCGSIRIQANSIEEALEKLDARSMLTGFVSLRNLYASAAHYTDAQGRTTYAFVYFQDIFPAGLTNLVEKNYGY